MASLARLHASKTNLGAVVEAFFADRDLAPATRRAYQATYGSLLQAFGAEMPLTALGRRSSRHRSRVFGHVSINVSWLTSGITSGAAHPCAVWCMPC